MANMAKHILIGVVKRISFTLATITHFWLVLGLPVIMHHYHLNYPFIVWAIVVPCGCVIADSFLIVFLAKDVKEELVVPAMTQGVIVAIILVNKAIFPWITKAVILLNKFIIWI